MIAILPRAGDNDYRGQKIALWIFGILAALRLTIGINSTVKPYMIATTADGIPIASYPAAAGQTIVALFAGLGLNHLLWAVLFIIVLLRYRTLVPLMFTLRLISSIIAAIQDRLHPLPTTGAPPGRYVMIVFLVLTISGLVLSLWPRRSAMA